MTTTLPELPELPSLDAITAQTDISAFMHPAVAEDLRAAALRKLWSVDPSIRDFVSPAVDYAYDWNTPGGAPGWGALGRADDVARMVAEVVDGFARPPAQHSPETEEVTPAHGSPADAHCGVATHPEIASDDSAVAQPTENAAPVADAPGAGAALASPGGVRAAALRNDAAEPSPRAGRRHGGAFAAVILPLGACA